MSVRECEACGYKKGTTIGDDGNTVEVNEDGDPFHKIKGDFRREKKYVTRRGGDTQKVNVLGCPECGTLMFEDAW
jgi:hypothetical protein